MNRNVRWLPRFAKLSGGGARVEQTLRPRVELLEERLVLTSLLPGFTETTVTTGISAATAMEFSPDDRLWVLEQGGNVKLVHADGSTATALHQTVDSAGERGMLGIAFDPNFAANHFVYLYYTNPNPGGASWATGEHNQLSRFTVNDTDPMHPTFGSEAPILDWNNLISATNHNGGAIHFGADGMLYADAGDNVQTFTVGPNTYRVSQSMDTLLGKQLRIDVSKFNSGVATRDDTAVGDLIPTNNPFVGTASGINQLIYVLGLRNPFTFAVQPGTGRMLINDVGENTWEEIDDDVASANYGWSGGDTDGFGHLPPSGSAGTYHDPLLAYAHSSGMGSIATGIAIVGGTFYNPTTVEFPSSYVGMYFYEDLGSGWIRYFNPNTPNSAGTPDGNSKLFASGTPGGLRDLKVDSAGNLYYLAGNDGSIRRISFTAAQVVGRNLFYNNSKYDGNSAAVNSADDAAIAADKSAYLPGSGAATFAAVSSYTLGINGLMIDLKGAHGTITPNDFLFRTGNNNSPASWTTLPVAATVATRAGAGTGGSDRVEITFPSNVIQKTWLEVIFKGNDATGGSDTNTGLVASDVFFWASAVADDGMLPDDASAFTTDANDELDARNNPKTLINRIPDTNLNDYNRDGQVSVIDQLAARNNPTTNLTAPKPLNISGAGPFAPDAQAAAAPPDPAHSLAAPAADSAAFGVGVNDVAAGLALSAVQLAAPAITAPSSSSAGARSDPDSGPLATITGQLARSNAFAGHALLQTIDQIAEQHGLHDETLDELLADLGLD